MPDMPPNSLLDAVLALYAQDAPVFNAAVLLHYLERYPAQARALRRYACLQLTSRQATRAEIEAELTHRD